MKKIILAGLVLVHLIINAQSKNTLLEQDFWKKSPGVEVVKAEIAKGNSPSEANRGNHDVVSIAINNNAPLETILFLIDQEGNSIDKTTHDGRLYLHWAANRGNVELVKYLIEKGSEINRTDDKGAIPISFAAANGQTNTEIYDLLIKAGNNPKQTFQNGANLLLLSIANDKDLKLADYFTSKGLSIHDTDDFGNTAFNYVARTGNIELLKTLLRKKVKYDDRALIFASQGTRGFSNPLETYKYLVEEIKLKPTALGDNGENVLHNIIRKPEQEEIIVYFLDKGVDVNQGDKDGNTVLMNAVRGRNLAVVETIFPKIKNINAKNAKGESALALALNNGSSEIAAFLLKNKADIKATDNNGNNVAYYLLQSYRPGGGFGPGGSATGQGGQKDEFNEKAELLTQYGFNLATPQKDGNTLYHLAAVKNDINLFKKISKFGVDVNAVNKDGDTALHKAALVAKDAEILKYLIYLGAKKDIKTEFDETAYDLASENESLIENKISIDFLKS